MDDTVQKSPTMCEALEFSCNGNIGMGSRKLILQSFEQNVDSVQYARPAGKCRSIMRKQSHLIVV